MVKCQCDKDAKQKKRENSVKENSFWDYLITIEILIIGLAEAVHLTAVLGGMSFRLCTVLLWALVGALWVLGAGVLFFRRQALAEAIKKKKQRGAAGSREERILYGVFALMVISQLLFIWIGQGSWREKDMTVETVGSFLASDGIYRVNPMTGLVYTEGMPLRIKILCLPTLYASVCRLTGLHPDFLIRTIVPTLTLISCYAAFASLAGCLFSDTEEGGSGSRRACFLMAVSLLLWAGAYRYGMDGFNILCCGWRGVSIRNGVILPWMFSLCLRKKWMSVLLCILAEACIVWTLYGCGVCLLAAAGMAGAQFCVKKWKRKGRAGKERGFA